MAARLLRDSRISPIYEGTNGIQAIDLLLKKILARRGRALTLYLSKVDEHIERYGAHPSIKPLFDELNLCREQMMDATESLQGKKQTNLNHLLLVASPYMEMFGHFCSAHMLIWGAGVAAEKLDERIKAQGDDVDIDALLAEDEEARFYHGNVQTARYFVYYVLPKIYGLARVIKRGDSSPVDMVF